MLLHVTQLKDQQAFTLLELIVSMALLATIFSAFLAALSALLSHKHDPLIKAQAFYIMEYYMDEILHKPFLDPASQQPCVNKVEADFSVIRDEYDDVCDYQTLATLPGQRMINGKAVHRPKSSDNKELSTLFASNEQSFADYAIAVEILQQPTLQWGEVNNNHAIRLIKVVLTIFYQEKEVGSLSAFKFHPSLE